VQKKGGKKGEEREREGGGEKEGRDPERERGARVWPGLFEAMLPFYLGTKDVYVWVVKEMLAVFGARDDAEPVPRPARVRS